MNVVLVYFCSCVSEVLLNSSTMSTDSAVNENTKSASQPADVTDDSCVFKYIEIVPLTRDTDGPCTTECDSGDWSAQVKQENLPAVKQELPDVRCVVLSQLAYIIAGQNLCVCVCMCVSVCLLTRVAQIITDTCRAF